MSQRKQSGAKANTILRLIDCQKQRRDEQQQATVQVLQALLNKAKRGELAGVSLSYRQHDGREDAVYTGVFWERPAEALQAAMCIMQRLTALHDAETCGPP
jgi:hypothetical protein